MAQNKVVKVVTINIVFEMKKWAQRRELLATCLSTITCASVIANSFSPNLRPMTTGYTPQTISASLLNWNCSKS